MKTVEDFFAEFQERIDAINADETADDCRPLLNLLADAVDRKLLTDPEASSIALTIVKRTERAFDEQSLEEMNRASAMTDNEVVLWDDLSSGVLCPVFYPPIHVYNNWISGMLIIACKGVVVVPLVVHGDSSGFETQLTVRGEELHTRSDWFWSSERRYANKRWSTMPDWVGNFAKMFLTALQNPVEEQAESQVIGQVDPTDDPDVSAQSPDVAPFRFVRRRYIRRPRPEGAPPGTPKINHAVRSHRRQLRSGKVIMVPAHRSGRRRTQELVRNNG